MARPRFRWFVPVAWLAAAAAATAEPQPSTPTLDPAALGRLERIVRTRGFTRGIPRDAVPAPDGRAVYFLRSGAEDGFQDLWVFDGATGTSRVFVTANSLRSEERRVGKEGRS